RGEGRARPHAPGIASGASARRRSAGYDGIIGGRGGGAHSAAGADSHFERERGAPVNNMLVMKFGGTSMGSAERMRVAAGLIGRERAKRPVCVVVSAMSKITDLLLDTMRYAELGDRANVEKNLATLLDRHTQACDELFAGSIDAVRFREAAVNAVQSLVSEFHRIAGGILMLGTRPPRSVDEAVAIGERLSSVLLAQFLEASGIPALAVNAADIIVTDAVFGNASPHMEQTRLKCQERIVPLIEQGMVPVVTGFNGATEEGQPTTL